MAHFDFTVSNMSEARANMLVTRIMVRGILNRPSIRVTMLPSGEYRFRFDVPNPADILDAAIDYAEEIGGEVGGGFTLDDNKPGGPAEAPNLAATPPLGDDDYDYAADDFAFDATRENAYKHR